MTLNKQKGLVSEINVTPLVDVMLVLLIIFMVSAPMMKEASKPDKGAETSMPTVDLPSDKTHGETPEGGRKAVTVSAQMISGGIRYFIDDKAVDILNMGEELKARGITSVKIRLDREIAYGKYMKILGVCKEAGIREIFNIYRTDEL
jgi:biopolymer transport protein TolR